MLFCVISTPLAIGSPVLDSTIGSDGNTDDKLPPSPERLLLDRTMASSCDEILHHGVSKPGLRPR